MRETDRDNSNLEQRLRDHYQHRYEQPPDPAIVWTRLLPHLDRQKESRNGLVQQAKWLPGFIGRHLARQKAALKYLHEEHFSMQDETYIDQVKAHNPPVVPQGRQPLYHRVLRIVEAGIAAVLVAGLLLAWFVVTRSQGNQASTPVPIFSYTGQPGESVYYSEWTPDNRYLTFMMCKQVPPGSGCRYLVWNAATKKVKQTLTLGSSPAPSGSGGENSMYSPDGRYSLIVNYDAPKHTATIALVNILAGQIKQIYRGDYYLSFPATAFSNDSKSVTFVGDDGHIYVWNTLANLLTLRSDPLGVTETPQLGQQIAWSTDDTRIFTEFFPQNGEPILQEWDAQTGHRLANIIATPTMSLPSSLLSFTTVADFSPDGQRILTINTHAGTIEERDSSTLKVLHTFSIPVRRSDGSYNAYWLANGARIVLDEGSHMYIWNSTTGQRIASFSSYEEVVPDGQGQYVAISQKDKRLEIGDVLTGKIVQTIPLTFPEVSFWLPGDRYLSISEGSTNFGKAWRIYDVLTGRLVASYQGVQAVMSGDGRYIAVERVGSPQTEVVCDAHNQNCTGLTTDTLQILAIH